MDEVVKEIIDTLGRYNFRVDWQHDHCSVIDDICEEEVFRFYHGYNKINANMTIADDIWSLVSRLRNKWIDKDKV